MSLLRLLSSGKSLVGLKDSTARYRMGHPGAMPKFGSGKNPFQTKPQPQPAAEAIAASAAGDGSAQNSPVSADEKKSVPAAAGPPVKTQSRPEVRNRFRFGSVFWAALRPLKSLVQRRRSKPAKQPRTQTSRTPVQAELSLDCVKVLRNDLSDADLEVVRAKAPRSVPAKAAAMESQPARPEDTEQNNVETKTHRVANRLASAGKA